MIMLRGVCSVGTPGSRCAMFDHCWRTAKQQIVNTLNDLAALWLIELFWLRCLHGRGSGFFCIVNASNVKVFTAFQVPVCLIADETHVQESFLKQWLSSPLVLVPPTRPLASLTLSARQIRPLVTPQIEGCGERYDISIQRGRSMKRGENVSASWLQFYVSVSVHIP